MKAYVIQTNKGRNVNSKNAGRELLKALLEWTGYTMAVTTRQRKEEHLPSDSVCSEPVRSINCFKITHSVSHLCSRKQVSFCCLHFPDGASDC
uniref:Uncharacterized protein n=1 Tax=Sus scrofa TaxID=9823 RepID=A0A8D0YWP0_PIG